MDAQTQKTVVRCYIEAWNTGNKELLDQVLAPGYVDHAHPEVRSLEQVKQALAKIRTAFPDFLITIESMLSEGDLVALRATVRRETLSHIMWFVRIADSKMVELWTGSEISS